ncbi:MAG: hypothetical protein K6U00_01315 [Armatimonadetes bacterium]|nr:hypothetical protein [Armatimonadota bacterium]
MPESEYDWLETIIARARQDLLRNELSRVKGRLRTVLGQQPHFRPALELMGEVYYRYGDYRNAVYYWGQAGYWNEQMEKACERVFKTVEKALASGNLRTARYCLYAFAGGHPPPEIAERLRLLQAAYYKLGLKKEKLTGLACVPVVGGCLLLGIGITCALLNGVSTSFGWLSIIAIVTIIIVGLVNFGAYMHAALSFRRTLQEATRSKS